MTNIVLLSVGMALGLMGCTTLSPQTSDVVHNPPTVARRQILAQSLGYPRSAGDCGPNAMAVAMAATGRNVEPGELKTKITTPAKKGTLPAAILATAREYGLLAIPVSGIRELLLELDAKHPVIVFQNLGLSWLPNWHYTVAVGYDLDRQEIIAVDDTTPTTTPMTYFERHWSLADFWGLVLLNPNQLASSADELKHLQAAAALEQLGQLEPAKQAYQTMISKWQNSLGARIGLGNVYYRQKDYPSAAKILASAVELHPASSVAKHNLEVARARHDLSRN